MQYLWRTPGSRTAPDEATPIGPPPLEIRGLTVAYHRRPVLWNVDYAAPPGGLIAVVGRTGRANRPSSRHVWGWFQACRGRWRCSGAPSPSSAA